MSHMELPKNFSEFKLRLIEKYTATSGKFRGCDCNTQCNKDDFVVLYVSYNHHKFISNDYIMLCRHGRTTAVNSHQYGFAFILAEINEENWAIYQIHGS